MAQTTPYEGTPRERIDMQKLGGVVSNAVTSISTKTGLPENEVLDIMEKVRVEMVGDLKGAILTLESNGAIPNVNADKLSMAMEEAIETIADATDLDTDEITEVFTKEEGASLDHIIFRLRERSRVDRSNQV